MTTSTTTRLSSASLSSRYKPYSRYKDSGVEWLGKIPRDWELKRLRFLAPIQREKLEEKPDDLPYIGLEQIESETGRLANNSAPEQVDSRVSRFKDGDVLFGKLRPYLAKALQPDFEGVCTRELVVLNPTSEMHSRYLLYQMLVRGHIGWLNSATYGTKMPRLSPQQINDSFLARPPGHEQQVIAEFLDRETAKIDNLIAQKERLIELLEEKRSALITHAVTKGLNPDAPLRDSGIEWLGKIPKHWKIEPLKRATRFVEGPGIMASDFSLDGVPLLRISCIGQRWVTLEGCDFVSPDLASTKWDHFRVQAGDLLISGSATSGICSEVNESAEGAVPYTGIMIIRPVPTKTSRDYLRWLFVSSFFKVQSELAKTGTAIQHFGPTHLARMAILLPELSEQKAIADYVDDENSKMDALREQIIAAIDRLKEYRAALITVAITGKIDVRGEIKAAA